MPVQIMSDLPRVVSGAVSAKRVCMRKMVRSRELLRGLLLGVLLAGIFLTALAGCENGGHFTLLGYTTKPTFDESIRTIYVPTALNLSYRKDIEFELTRAVHHELGTSPYRLVSDRRRADTELLLKIVNRRKGVILQNQLGESRDVEIGLSIEVIWRDLRPGHIGDVLSVPTRFDPNLKPLPGDPVAQAPKEVPILIMPTATYIPELGGSTISAEKKAVDRAAMQIVQMMEVWR